MNKISTTISKVDVLIPHFCNCPTKKQTCHYNIGLHFNSNGWIFEYTNLTDRSNIFHCFCLVNFFFNLKIKLKVIYLDWLEFDKSSQIN